MERVIKFRGKSIVEDEWIYGLLSDFQEEYGYAEINYDDTCDQVYINSVGQFTGLYDSNGVEIYEGDVCRLDCYPHWNQTMCVGWHKETAHFGFRIKGESYIGCNGAFSDWIREKRITVIGNVYDSPDWEERK